MVGEPLDLLVPSLVFVFASTLAFALWPKRQQHPYPPGPPPKPLIGNALDIPSKKPCAKYLSWSKEYNSGFSHLSMQLHSDVWRLMSGDIIHLTAMHIHIVVLNKMKDVVSLFEKRSAIYSDRVAIPVCKMMYEGVDVEYARTHFFPDWAPNT